METYAVVADIGGTNARFSRINLTTFELDRIQVFACADFPTLTDVMLAYSKEQEVKLEHVAIAIACPVDSDEINMTNHHWPVFSAWCTKIDGLENLLLYSTTSLLPAMSIVTLKPHELKQIGGGKITQNAPKAVLGAGTGTWRGPFKSRQQMAW